MPGISKRGSAYRIIVSLGYDLKGKQIRKTTTFTPPAGTAPSKAEKLATAYAYEFEAKCRGMLSLNENIRFIELADWYFQQVAPLRLKERSLQSNQYLIQTCHSGNRPAEAEGHHAPAAGQSVCKAAHRGTHPRALYPETPGTPV